jgi:hypothetical protein
MFFPNFSLQKCPTFINVGTILSMLLILIGCNLHGIKPDLKLGWALLEVLSNQENKIKIKN